MACVRLMDWPATLEVAQVEEGRELSRFHSYPFIQNVTFEGFDIKDIEATEGLAGKTSRCVKEHVYVERCLSNWCVL